MPRSWIMLPGLLFLLGCLSSDAAPAPAKKGARPEKPMRSHSVAAMVDQYCVECHDAESKKGGLDLQAASLGDPSKTPDVWEKVVRRLRTRQMPPAERKQRPSEKEYEAVVADVSRALDENAARHPNPGRTETFRRLNPTEYHNAIRDLLDLDIDVSSLLPKEEAGHGFDNVTVADLSPTLLDRYLSAAQKISRLAVGSPVSPGGDTIRLRPDLTQEEHVEGLPLGTRGGVVISHTFPRDADYEIQIRLTRDRNEEVEGLREEHDVELLIDRAPVKSFTIAPPRGNRNFEAVDQHLKARIPIKAGPHQIGVTFVKKGSSLLETRRQPYQSHFNMHRHPRITPAVYQVSINGPYDSSGPGDTPSRRKIFISKPSRPEQEEASARKILRALMRRAYRRSVAEEDLEVPMDLYRTARAESGFDAGIEAGLSAILASPHFLLRVEHDPKDIAPGTAYRINDLELASRLSFFLWSSIPDDALLDAGIRGDLHQPATLDKEVRRMLADPRSESLVQNFAGQWLYLRNLDSFVPDLRQFPDFDENLRQALRIETELCFHEIVREDRSVLQLIQSDHTYLNERLAKHYEIPHVFGSRFRPVAVTTESHRGSLLCQGSVLTVTSYATRTSPVKRGQWILSNLLGTPPPPALPNVPALKDNTVSAALSVRERLAAHRANPACASCHNLMDPIGLSLENFDAVGRWRTLEEGKPVDASGGMPDGRRFTGFSGLESGLLDRPEVFVGTLAEKLLTFALGRGIDYSDGPAIRRIVREARESDYKFSAIIIGITRSVPFRMRTSL